MNQDNGLFSVDRLVEFGLGMAMAQQMVQMFNQTISAMNTQVPVYGQGTIQQNSPIFYVGIDGKPVGPLHEYDIVQFYQTGKINKESLAWMPGMAQWQRIEEVPAILKVIAMVPPAMPNLQF